MEVISILIACLAFIISIIAIISNIIPSLNKSIVVTARITLILVSIAVVIIGWAELAYSESKKIEAFAVLVSAFGTLGLLVTIFLQNRSIKQFEIQRVESAFFQLLQGQREIVNSMDYRNKSQIISQGKDVFRTYFFSPESPVSGTRAQA